MGLKLKTVGKHLIIQKWMISQYVRDYTSQLGLKI